jgi:hypothetical protein
LPAFAMGMNHSMATGQVGERIGNPLRRPFHLRRRTSCAAGRLPVTIPST